MTGSTGLKETDGPGDEVIRACAGRTDGEVREPVPVRIELRGDGFSKATDPEPETPRNRRGRTLGHPVELDPGVPPTLVVA